MERRLQMKKINFYILATGFNCEGYVKPCIDSIVNQLPGPYNYQTLLVSDGSTDGTLNELNRLHPPFGMNINIAFSGKNLGAALQRHHWISKYAEPGDVVILLGLDDELLPNALNTIADQYQQGKWMTYGNWINQYGKGLPDDFELEFCDTTHETRSYRQVKYRSTAPNTFRVELFNRIPVNDFQLNGKWIDTTTESEIMFSCLEMCGKERIGVIKEPIYLYNQDLPNGTQRRLGQEYKNSVYAEIIKRPKKAQVFEL